MDLAAMSLELRAFHGILSGLGRGWSSLLWSFVVCSALFSSMRCGSCTRNFQGIENCVCGPRKPWVKPAPSGAVRNLGAGFQRAGFSPFIFPLQEFRAPRWNLLCKTGGSLQERRNVRVHPRSLLILMARDFHVSSVSC